MMHDVMIDLETLGTTPDSAILTIGCVLFDIETGQIGREFYARIDRQKAQQYGRTDPDTLRWWMGQDSAARAEAWEGTEDPRAVARALREWLGACCPRGKLNVWGNGSIMDIALMEGWFRRVEPGTKYPWDFWNIMDMRTAMRLGELRMPRSRPDGVQLHNALHDARFQVEWLCKAYRNIAGDPSPTFSQIVCD